MWYTPFFMSVLMLLLLKVYHRVCEMTHLTKHLPCSHKDLSLIPRTLGAVAGACNSSSGEAETIGSWGLLGSPPFLLSSNREALSRKQAGGSTWGMTPQVISWLPYACAHMHLNWHARMHVHTHIYFIVVLHYQWLFRSLLIFLRSLRIRSSSCPTL